MDEPVGLPNCPPWCKEPTWLAEEIDYALCFDDKVEFLRLIKDPMFQDLRGIEFGVHEVFAWDALNCAIAFLNGETKGSIDIEEMEEGCTPLHYAAMNHSLKITKYLLETGHSVDVYCDWPYSNLKQATPINFIITEFTDPRGILNTRWIHRHSVYELLVVLCCKKRRNLEILRMLVRNTQNKEHVRQTFMDYADKGELVPVAFLFLAAPELFLSSYFITPGVASSSIATLNHVLNSLEKRTDVEEAMLLLVDALAVAGHKFVAYTRLQFSHEQDDFLHLDIAFLVREVARIKQRLSSPDDYFLRFFKPVRPEADQPRNIPGHERIESWPHKHEDVFFRALPFELKRHDLDQAYINKVLPSLATEDADRLNNAIEKKLSLMPTLYGRLEDYIWTPKQGVKIPVRRLLLSFNKNFKGSIRSLTYMAANGECGLNFRNTPKSMRTVSTKPTSLGFLFSHLRLFKYFNAIKRVIK